MLKTRLVSRISNIEYLHAPSFLTISIFIRLTKHRLKEQISTTDLSAYVVIILVKAQLRDIRFALTL